MAVVQNWTPSGQVPRAGLQVLRLGLAQPRRLGFRKSHLDGRVAITLLSLDLSDETGASFYDRDWDDLPPRTEDLGHPDLLA